MEVGVFGGTFDPIHIGHLIIAEQIYNDFDIEKILFIPAGRPPHKSEQEISSGEKRLHMVKLAIRDNPHFSYSDIELGDPGKSYTADTLEYLSNIDKNNYSLILGADSLRDIFTWKNPYYLLENYRLIVAGRPGVFLEDILKDERLRPYRNNINLMENLLLNISSSKIRNYIKQNKSVKYLIPETVFNYINGNGLYLG